MHLVALTKLNPPQGPQNTWIHTAEGWIHSHIIQQVNTSTNQKKTAHRKGCFVFSPLSTQAFYIPLPSPSLGSSHQLSMPSTTGQLQPLQGSASLWGCVSQGGWKRQRRGITSCGHRSARCGRYPWDSQQTRQEVHPLLSQHHPQCAHQCHETSPEHSHHPRGYKCLKEERELKHTTLSRIPPFPYCTTRRAGLDFEQHNVILGIFNMASYSLSLHSWLLVGKERKVSLCAYRYQHINKNFHSYTWPFHTSCSQCYTHNDDFNNVLNRQRERQVLNISFQLTVPNLVTRRKKDFS